MGCGTNAFHKGVGGAAAGAVSASFVGALTDLIVDGRVNTYRLQRNMVSGAIAGGATGAAVGAQQDRQQAAQKQARREQAARQQAQDEQTSERELVKRIGKDNYRALEDLIHFRHKDAFARTLKSTRSKNTSYQAAGYAIQALVDNDRGNADGVAEALEKFLGVSDEVDSMKEAQKGLKDLAQGLHDERRVQGIRPPR
jgi:hypothetical protein